MRIPRIIALAIVLAAAAAAQPRVDSRRGERLFQTEGCVQCHSVQGSGGRTAPDLGKRIDRNYTPALLASVMWNHAPSMWSAMRERGVPTAPLSDQDAADLFAFFYAARFFDRPGDAARGKRLFAVKHCAECHGLAAAVADGGPPVAQWRSLGDPILLAEAMWNHAGNMRQRFAQRGFRWPEITGQELTDLLVYLRNSPAGRQIGSTLDTSAGENGQALFTSKGCSGCHIGKLDLTPRLRGKTLTDIAADMWNHSPKMRQPPPTLASGEMRQIASYLWSRQLFEQDGAAVAGKAVFTKDCAVCHADRSSGAPDLSARHGNFSSASMVSALWRHGPRMLEQMKAKNLSWPYLTARQMADLIAYLNAGS